MFRLYGLAEAQNEAVVAAPEVPPARVT